MPPQVRSIDAKRVCLEDGSPRFTGGGLRKDPKLCGARRDRDSLKYCDLRVHMNVSVQFHWFPFTGLSSDKSSKHAHFLFEIYWPDCGHTPEETLL